MRLKEYYKKEIIAKLQERFKYDNENSVPKLEKVVLNVGFGRHTKDKAYIENIQSSLSRISGQKPILNKAKKSISSFKIREGMIIGAKVTLRGQRMYDFIEKLVGVTYPRVRDFRGISAKAIDNKGNITLGFKENLPFPEIRADEVDNVHGLEICIHSTAKNKEEGLALYEMVGFPFKKDE